MYNGFYLSVCSYRYEIGLGTTQGGSQIISFYSVPADKTMTIIDNLNLMGVRKVRIKSRYEIGLGTTQGGSQIKSF